MYMVSIKESACQFNEFLNIKVSGVTETRNNSNDIQFNVIQLLATDGGGVGGVMTH